MRKAVLVSRDLRVINEFTQICTVTGHHFEIEDELQTFDKNTKYFVDESCSEVDISAAEVHVICIGKPTAQVWLLAGKVSANSILTLPADRSQLIELLTPENQVNGKVIAITQAAGGSGATTLACAIAHQLKNSGYECILLDANNQYAGLDLAIGDLNDEPIYSSALINNISFGINGLNQIDGLRFIANNSQLESTQWISFINYLKSKFEYVVIDIEKQILQPEIIQLCDFVVVSLTNTIRQAAVTRLLLNDLQEAGVNHGLAVRSVGGASLDPLAIAEKLQIPLWASLPTDNRITEQIECGFGVSMIKLASFTRAIAQLTIRLTQSDENVRSA